MPRYKYVDGIRIQFTTEEETARDAEEKAWEDAKPSRAFKALRIKRVRLLAETDYFALSDVTMSDDMTAYRKALRDLPAQYDNSSILSDEITRPVKP